MREKRKENNYLDNLINSVFNATLLFDGMDKEIKKFLVSMFFSLNKLILKSLG